MYYLDVDEMNAYMKHPMCLHWILWWLPVKTAEILNVTIGLKTTPEERTKKKKELENQWWRRELSDLLSGLKYIPGNPVSHSQLSWSIWQILSQSWR